MSHPLRISGKSESYYLDDHFRGGATIVVINEVGDTLQFMTKLPECEAESAFINRVVNKLILRVE